MDLACDCSFLEGDPWRQLVRHVVVSLSLSPSLTTRGPGVPTGEFSVREPEEPSERERQGIEWLRGAESRWGLAFGLGPWRQQHR